MKFLLLAALLLGSFLTTAFPAWGDSGIFDQSRVMVENSRLSDAEEMLQQWLDGHPEDQEARFLLARILAWQDKHADALAQYIRLLEKEPGNNDYLRGRAMLPTTVRP
jgi:TolA-binding protein